MPATAQIITLDRVPEIRTFGLADLSSHGKWVLPRFMKAYPHHSERSAASFLQALGLSNEFLCLHQKHGIALMQVLSAHTLTAKPLIQEHFVWLEDPLDKQQQLDGAWFYPEFRRWGKGLGCEVMVIEEMTDVPHELIRERLDKRIFSRQQQFARI